MAYVIVIGLDKGENGGVTVTFEIQNPQFGSSDIAKAENEPSSEILTFTAPDITSAKDTANSIVARRLTFAHTKTLIVGEEYARSEDFYYLVGELPRNRELRGGASVIITKEKAEDFIRANKSQLETRPHKFYVFMAARWKESGIAPRSDIHRLLQRTEQDIGVFLAIYATAKKSNETKYGNEDEYLPGQIKMKTKNPVQMIGPAVLKEGKMIGSLTGDETRMVMLLRTGFKLNGIAATYKDPLDPKYRISTTLYKDKDPEIKVDTSSENPKISVTVPVKIDVIDIHSHTNYVEDIEKQDLLKQHIKKELEDKAKKLIEKTKNEFKGDPFVWGLEARKNFWTYDEYIAYDWAKSYPNAQVNVEFDVSLVGFGKELGPSEIKRIRD